MAGSGAPVRVGRLHCIVYDRPRYKGGGKVDNLAGLTEAWQVVDGIVAANTERTIHAFREGRLASIDLMGSTGYGYQDRGRERLDAIFAEVFGTPSALVRAQWVSGTHAIATALKAVTEPGTRLWCASGRPYDTIEPTLELMRARGVHPMIVDTNGGDPDLARISLQAGDVVYAQRSRGYGDRRSWGESELRRLADWTHQNGGWLVVDNCYGEFTQTEEPGHWGADLVIGSLMKNPGGSVAPTGAYVAGQTALVDRVATELFAPGIGSEVGATGPYLRLMAQGLFLAPLLVGEALKGGLAISWAAERRGIPVDPPLSDIHRNDIVVSLSLPDAEAVVRFCQVLQEWEPVDGFVVPEPWDMPGYAHPVIMAAGGFVAGGSLELSADAPLRAPYRVYVQGGVNHWHTQMAVNAALDAVLWQRAD